MWRSHPDSPLGFLSLVLGRRRSPALLRVIARLDWFIPEALQKDETSFQRARMFVAAHYLGAPLGHLLTAYLYLLDPDPGLHLWILVGGIAVFYALPVILRLTAAFTFLSMLTVENVACVVLFGAYHYGGVSSPFLCWLLVVPLLAFFYLGPSPAARIIVLGSLGLYLAGFYALHFAGHRFPEHVPLEQLVGVGILSVFLASLFVTMMAMYYAQVIARSAEIKAAHLRAEQDREKAEIANRAKSEFLARMSHELRTPLHSILGFAQLLEFSSKDPLTPGQAKQVGQIRRGGSLLLSLIDEVLDLSKIESGRMKVSIEPVALAPLLAEIEAALRPLAERAGVALAVTPPALGLAVEADRTRLNQVLMNLCTNAIKYNRQNGRVQVSAATESGGIVRISVSDTGIGIPAERQRELFQPFNRLGAEQSNIEGTGIGLAIAHRLVHLMRGRISCQSEEGVGSEFRVDLPAAKHAYGASAAASLAASEWPDHRGGYCLLYVEDNPGNVALMRDLLAELPNVRMLSAAEPRAGYDLAVAHRPDLIVLDVNLPGMSGFELLQLLKREPVTKAIPVIALTASALPRDLERGLAAGFVAYMTKPIDVPKFLAAVDSALGVRV